MMGTDLAGFRPECGYEFHSHPGGAQFGVMTLDFSARGNRMLSAHSPPRHWVVACLMALGLVAISGGNEAFFCTRESSVVLTAARGAAPSGLHPSINQLSTLGGPHRLASAEPPDCHDREACVGTPSQASGVGENAAPGQIGTEPAYERRHAPRPPSISARSGREPPAPDTVSTLCVARV